MEFNLFALLGISLAAMFFGYFFGLFEGRGQGYNKRKKEEELNKGTQGSADRPRPASAPIASGAALLRLSMDRNQRPSLELDGDRAEVSTLGPDQRKRLIDLMLIMRPWVEGPPSGRPVSETPTTPPPVIRPGMASGSRPAAASAVPVSSAGLSAPRMAEAGLVGTPTTMVGQIDAILQIRLAGTSLADRGIRLVESAQGGATVIVGVNRYAGVGDVPDSEAQSAIRAAIAEWEKKYTPGL